MEKIIYFFFIRYSCEIIFLFLILRWISGLIGEIRAMERKKRKALKVRKQCPKFLTILDQST